MCVRYVVNGIQIQNISSHYAAWVDTDQLKTEKVFWGKLGPIVAASVLHTKRMLIEYMQLASLQNGRSLQCMHPSPSSSS